MVNGPDSKVGNQGSNPRGAVLTRISRADISQAYHRENLIHIVLRRRGYSILWPLQKREGENMKGRVEGKLRKAGMCRVQEHVNEKQMSYLGQRNPRGDGA